MEPEGLGAGVQDLPGIHDGSVPLIMVSGCDTAVA